ncbi:uroporphyrinogen-III C-methyltransferase [Anoxynatronum sibiricum]|uniref:uroporphyrinogen-III C-methyltransferase n=1 Tax=Anoxynatronum sibiricum TaxID=210623 RepID=A0ABU9VVV9_9CLOT
MTDNTRMIPIAGPMVFLVGAGPGAEDLITVKGLRCLQQAQVVLYDRLSGESLLKEAPPEAELIDVGKQPDHHPVPQETINQLLVEKAGEGKLVVRLKGGDPFVFGRGGEEALALEAAGIPFEVVPGISSAIAVPSYGGIPVTHRHMSTSFHVITGHEDPEKPEEAVNYQLLAQLSGTLVFLMGVGRLPQITRQLMTHGKDPRTPVALIHRGTTPSQKTVCGNLVNIVERVEIARLKPPCVIVVGEVVSLQPALSWVERKPLFGRRVLVTRSRQQASGLAAKLRWLGAQVEELPTIAIRPPKDPVKLSNALEDLTVYDHLIFTSVNGVEAFFQLLLETGRDVRSLSPETEITAIGQATAAAIESRGLRVTRMPEVFTGEGVLEALTPIIRKGQRVLLPRAEIGRPQLVKGLEALEAIMTDLPVYETVIPEADPAKLQQLVKHPPHWITFTSASTINHFMAMLNQAGLPFPRETHIAAIGPVTADAVRHHGLEVTAEAEPHTIDALVAAIQAADGSFSERRKESFQ